MSPKDYLRLLAMSLLAALVLSVGSMAMLITLTEQAANRPHNDFLLFFSSSIEDRLSGLKETEFTQAVLDERLRDDHFGPFGGPSHFNGGGPHGPSPFAHGENHGSVQSALPTEAPPEGLHMPPPGPPPGEPGDPPMLEPGGGHGPDDHDPGHRPGPHLNYWIVSLNNKIIFTSSRHGSNDKFVPDPSKMAHPSAVHEVVSDVPFLPTMPTTSVVMLSTSPAMYLVVREEPRPFMGTLFKTQAALTFGTVLGALLIAISLMFIYLQRKSAEARSVLLRLGQGDLRARFEIRRFDEFGGLLIDFNRMAEEIEHLVGRIRETETVRKNLLQELGHDLRTPLTSLTTSFETIQEHGDRMQPADRADLFLMIGAEISYFKDLLEKLMTIASLDEPHYRNSSEVVDFSELVFSEVRSRSGLSTKLKWRLENTADLRVLGDEHLLQRLLRNAFENAARYARTVVDVRVVRDREMVSIEVIDDGPGLSDEDLDLFGKRREKRRERERIENEKLNFSLGLGSVIMKAITHLHHGQIKIENQVSQNERAGARLVISLPLVGEAAPALNK